MLNQPLWAEYNQRTPYPYPVEPLPWCRGAPGCRRSVRRGYPRVMLYCPDYPPGFTVLVYVCPACADRLSEGEDDLVNYGVRLVSDPVRFARRAAEIGNPAYLVERVPNQVFNETIWPAADQAWRSDRH